MGLEALAPKHVESILQNCFKGCVGDILRVNACAMKRVRVGPKIFVVPLATAPRLVARRAVAPRAVDLGGYHARTDDGDADLPVRRGRR